MKIETIAKWYVYGIVVYFLLRNVAIIPLSGPISATIFRELIIILLVLLIEFYSRTKARSFVVTPGFLSSSVIAYLMFLATGVLSLGISLITTSKYSQIIALKYYIFDFFIISYFVYKIYDYVPIKKLYDYTFKLGCFLAIAGILQLIMTKLGIVSLETIRQIYFIPVFETRISSIITNPNLLALILLISLSINYDKRTTYIFLNFVILIAIMLTGSRLYSLIAGVVFLFKYLNSKRAIGSMILVFIPLFIYSVSNFSIHDRMIETINRRGIDPRYAMWETVLDKNIKGLSLFIGNGFGNIGTYYGIENSIDHEVIFNGKIYLSKISFIDNSMLTMLNESGIIGLSFFLLFILVNLYVKFSDYKKNLSPLSKASLTIQIIIIIGSIFGDVFYSYPILFFYTATIFNQRSKELIHEKAVNFYR